MQFTELGLSPELLRAIGEQGYTTPTPIQAQAITAGANRHRQDGSFRAAPLAASDEPDSKPGG